MQGGIDFEFCYTWKDWLFWGGSIKFKLFGFVVEEWEIVFLCSTFLHLMQKKPFKYKKLHRFRRLWNAIFFREQVQTSRTRWCITMIKSEPFLECLIFFVTALYCKIFIFLEVMYSYWSALNIAKHTTRSIASVYFTTIWFTLMECQFSQTLCSAYSVAKSDIFWIETISQLKYLSIHVLVVHEWRPCFKKGKTWTDQSYKMILEYLESISKRVSHVTPCYNPYGCVSGLIFWKVSGFL